MCSGEVVELDVALRLVAQAALQLVGVVVGLGGQ
jgi:hypothetical protein